MGAYLLAIDQGTTSSRAMVLDAAMRVIATAQQPIAQHYPRPGWVEHEPEEIWRTVLATARAAVASAGVGAQQLAGIGITNQRETVVVWERASGRPIHPAIVWQDRRTAATCAQLAQQGAEVEVTTRTGLVLDPYFSATKLAWLLDHVEGARDRAERGELAAGTIDTFLLWRLTGGRVHATDASNAARTSLFDIHAGDWCPQLCRMFRVPAAILPRVHDSAGELGGTAPDLLGGSIPVRAMIGDQQAALVGQACLKPGMMKATYGTGCFAILNTGAQPVASRHRLLTTVAYRLAGRTTYALEGAIFVAGAAVQWLRDGLGLIAASSEADALAAAASDDDETVMVPAFVGLGAPHWDAEARGALLGLTRGTGKAEIVRAALESVAFQTHDLVTAMRGDWPATGDGALRVDGGMVVSDWTMQRLADILALPVERPANRESTALGAAYLAGLQAGMLHDPQQWMADWACERRFLPEMPAQRREVRLGHWRRALGRTLSRPNS